MMRKTTTILAVAFTAACGGTATEAATHKATPQELSQELANTPLADAIKNRDHFAPLCDDNGYPLPGNVNGKGGDAKVSQFCEAIGPKPPQMTPDPPSQPQQQPDPKPTPTTPACDMNALNQELSNDPLDIAVAQHEHFRCLCDDKGYPLVGNINSKGTTASAFCGALKDKALL